MSKILVEVQAQNQTLHYTLLPCNLNDTGIEFISVIPAGSIILGAVCCVVPKAKDRVQQLLLCAASLTPVFAPEVRMSSRRAAFIATATRNLLVPAAPTAPPVRRYGDVCLRYRW